MRTFVGLFVCGLFVSGALAQNAAPIPVNGSGVKVPFVLPNDGAETPAGEDCINFDDIPTDGAFLTPVPGAYVGHCWSDLCAPGGRWYADLTSAIRSGYGSSLPDVSSPNIAYNGFGDVDNTVVFSAPVALESCQITRWPNVPGQDATSVRFVGTLGGASVFDFSVATTNDVWSPVDFQGKTVDTLVVNAVDGPSHWWLMDDLCFGGCNGNEFIKKAKCKVKDGAVKKAAVLVQNATDGQEYTCDLATGQSTTAVGNNGKAKFKFSGGNRPPCGPNTATVCGQSADFNCGC